jgi:hypothetical protein
MGDM